MFDYSAKTGVHIVTALPSHLHKSKHVVHLLSKNMTFTVGTIKKFTFRYKKPSLNDSNIIINEAKYFDIS